MKNTGEVLKNKLLADLILATAALVLIAVAIVMDYLYYDKMEYVSLALCLLATSLFLVRSAFTRQKNLTRSAVTDVLQAAVFIGMAIVFVAWSVKLTDEIPSMSKSRTVMTMIILGFYSLAEFVDILDKFIRLSLGLPVTKERKKYHKAK